MSLYSAKSFTALVVVLSHFRLRTPRTVALCGPLSMGFYRQEFRSG